MKGKCPICDEVDILIFYEDENDNICIECMEALENESSLREMEFEDSLKDDSDEV